MFHSALALAALMLDGAPQSAKPVEADVKITNVSWLRPPDSEAVAQYMPPFAALIGVGGRIDMRCSVQVEGPPQYCSAAATPEGLGFEQAAQLVAATGVLSPRLVDGLPQPAALRFVVNFHAEPVPERPVPPYDGPEPSPRGLSLARQAVSVLATQEGFEPYREGRQAWMAMVEDLPPDRQPTVSAWLEELFPEDEQKDRERSALALARLVSEPDLEAFLKTGTIPPPPSEADFERAYGLHEDADVKAIATLRQRFCSRWDCGIGSDE